eukprot:TRINITY_DN30172_c0_g1_i1.p1 TRINITY_DN30172_c0_g1~~TRINITY_DN30172_c0_g1_i1.p1  ORF type:complete len:195 (-),score=37.97 TRINITY_DN30172_c0_g1_i1:62-622(-)
MSLDDYPNIDDHMFEKEPDKAGFHDIWVGVANATDQTIRVETHVDSSVAEETLGWKLNVGGVDIPGVGGFSAFKFAKDARRIVQKDTVSHKEPEELPKFTYKKFHLNSDSTNKSNIVQVIISKEADQGKIVDVKKRHGIIVRENKGELEVFPSAGQYFSANAWKPHKQCRDPELPRTFDPKKTPKK